MSFLVDKLAKRAGDMVADKIKSSLGGGDDKGKKNNKKDDKDGGFLSVFKKDKEEDDDHKGGLFSFGQDKNKNKNKNKNDDGKGNFIQKLLNKDDDENREKMPKRSGFSGLFSEQDQPGGEGPEDMDPEDTAPESGPCDHMSEGDLDLMSDLMEVANQTS